MPQTTLPQIEENDLAEVPVDGDEEISEEEVEEFSEQESQADQPVISLQAQWNAQFEKLGEFKEKHGHCEWFSVLDHFINFLSTPTNTPPVSLLDFQAMCHKGTRKTRHWASGSTISVHASKRAKWIGNEKWGSTKLVSISIPRPGTMGKSGIRSSRSCVNINDNMVTVSWFGLSTVLHLF
jgi:hypothetical protein